jgi:hypothetical protein
MSTMHLSPRWQRFLFILFLCAITIPVAVKIWAIRPLYIDSAKRQTLEHTLRTIADEQGWLLSDISIEQIRGNTVVIEHRFHIRGEDPENCFTFDLPSSHLTPCVPL